MTFGLARLSTAGLLLAALVLSPVYARDAKQRETGAFTRASTRDARIGTRGADVHSNTGHRSGPRSSPLPLPAEGLVVPCP